MLTDISPKLPMRDKAVTREFYTNKLGFKLIGSADYPEYLMLEKDDIQLHFFLHKKLKPSRNYGQAYIRTNNIDTVYKDFVEGGVSIHPNGPLETKPWAQREFALLDPDHNLLTFGQAI